MSWPQWVEHHMALMAPHSHCYSGNSQIISPVCFLLPKPCFAYSDIPIIHKCTCAHRKFYFSTLIFNSLCEAHSEDLVLSAELPEAWLHVPLAASFSTLDWSHLQARCLTSKKDSLPSTCLLPMEAVNNAGPFPVSWRAGVSNHHLQVNYFYFVTNHLLLSQWRHTSHSLPRWQMPSCLPHTWKSSYAVEPDWTCTAGVLLAARKKLAWSVKQIK